MRLKVMAAIFRSRIGWDKIGISSAWQRVVTSARTKVAFVSDIQVTKIGKTTELSNFETLQEQAKKKF